MISTSYFNEISIFSTYRAKKIMRKIAAPRTRTAGMTRSANNAFGHV
jgi:hypothetical protein